LLNIKDDAMATQLAGLFGRALLHFVATCRLPVMWIFRSASQDAERSVSPTSSRDTRPDIKAVKSNLEKLRGYHDLAKAGAPVNKRARSVSCLLLGDDVCL
jgi:hypothetical protein